MLKDKDLDNRLFSVATGFPGKHPDSDRDAVIEELRTQGKWQSENQIGNMTNNSSNVNNSSERRLAPGLGLLGSLTCM